MKIGIVGTGNMGAAIGALLAHAGHHVTFSFSRDTSKLSAATQAAGLNARMGSVAETVRTADAIVLATAFPALDLIYPDLGTLPGRTLISCVSGLQPDFTGRTIGLSTSLTRSVAELIAERTSANVVESFNTTFAESLRERSRNFNGEIPSLLY